MFAYLLQGLVLGGTAAIQPGPFQVYLLSQTLKNGWLRTLPAALAPLISDGPIIALVVFILTQTPAWFLILLRLVGGLFLLYLAWGAYKGMGKTAVSDPPANTATQQSVLKAALMNALSPNPYIYWATITGPILIEAWRNSALSGLGFLLGFYGALVGGFAGFVILFALSGRLDARVNRVLGGASALALFAFGVYQWWLGGTAVIALL
ncbi:MAG: LysE family transporter [Chloroflexota bacterium]